MNANVLPLPRMIYNAANNIFQIWVGPDPLPEGWTDRWYTDGAKIHVVGEFRVKECK
jgi:hypothetical protein